MTRKDLHKLERIAETQEGIVALLHALHDATWDGADLDAIRDTAAGRLLEEKIAAAYNQARITCTDASA